MIEVRNLDHKSRSALSRFIFFQRQQERTVRSASGANWTTSDGSAPQGRSGREIQLEKIPLVVAYRKSRLDQELAVDGHQCAVIRLFNIRREHRLRCVAGYV